MMKRRAWTHWAGGLFLAHAAFAVAVSWAGQEPVPVLPGNLTSNPSRSGAGHSHDPKFSADGRFVLFTSTAWNLTTNDTPSPHMGCYIRDLEQKRTRLVSVSLGGVGGANEDCYATGISFDGSRVVWGTEASNLVTNEPARAGSVFIRDLLSEVTVPVAVGMDGARLEGCFYPLMSTDGRWVFFISTSSNLVAEPAGNRFLEVYARNLQTNQTFLVSDQVDRSIDISGIVNHSDLISITPDGHRVAFVNGSGLYPINQLLVRDMEDGRTLVASTNLAAYFQGDYLCDKAALSEDGRFVAFMGSGGSPRRYVIFHHDLDTQTTVPISPVTMDSTPRISATGRWVAYDEGTNVFVWDSTTQSNVLVSVNLDESGPGNGPSRLSGMTPDGQRVAFLSTSTNLATNAVSGGFQIYVRDLVQEKTVLASVGEDGNACRTDLEFASVAITPDGGKVAFDSLDDRLAAGDANQASDIFVRDLVAMTTRLVSERHETLPDWILPDFSTLPNLSCLSSNGARVAFSSPRMVHQDPHWIRSQTVIVSDWVSGELFEAGATDQDAGDPALSADGNFLSFTRWATYDVRWGLGSGDIYRFDVESRATELVSARMDGSPAGLSGGSSISPDGKWVAYESRAGDLVPQGTPDFQNIFLRDMDHGSNILISVGSSGMFADGLCSNPLFSPDGRWILFQSRAGNLDPLWPNPGYDAVFARDLSANVTRLVSTHFGSVISLNFAYTAFSPDSRWVAFLDMNTRFLFASDLESNNEAEFLSPADPRFRYLHPAMSRGGEFLIYETYWDRGFALPQIPQLILHHRPTGTTNVITTDWQGNGLGNGGSTFPSISERAQVVVYASQASNLVPDDTNGVSDIFVYDRLKKTTMLVSVTADGRLGNSHSTMPILSQDGRVVAFQSHAGNFAEGDFDGRRDIFVLRLSLSDSDQDGLDDDWEMAYFDTLDRDGSGDFDGDGANDSDELFAGTDPTNQGSVLRVMILLIGVDRTRTLLWPVTPGKRYRLEYRDSAGNGPWQVVPGTPGVAAGTASLQDYYAPAVEERFYRVQVYP